MALINFTGFENGPTPTGNHEFPSAATGYWEPQYTGIVRTGSYAGRAIATTTQLAAQRIGGFISTGAPSVGNYANLYLTFHFQIVTLPGGGNTEEICSFFKYTNPYKAAVRIDPDGKLSLWDSVPSQIGSTGTTVLTTGVWYRIEVYCGTGAAGSMEVRINGVSEISTTGNLGTVNSGDAAVGKYHNRSNQGVEFIYDDVWLDDAAYQGDFEVKRMVPDGDGNYTAWTGTYADVDEQPPDNDTSYIYSSTSGHAETITLQSASAAGISGTVHAVQAWAVIREASTVTSAVQVRMRSGSTDSDTTSRNFTTSYQFNCNQRATDPAGAAWTLSALDSLEVGVENNAANTIRCSYLAAMVAYTPVRGGAFPHHLDNQHLTGGLQSMGI